MFCVERRPTFFWSRNWSTDRTSSALARNDPGLLTKPDPGGPPSAGMITPSLPAVCGLRHGVSCGTLYPSTSGSFLASAEANLVDDDGRAFGQATVCRLDHDFPGKRRLRELGTDGSHDGDRAVLVGDVILDDDGGPSLLNLVAERGIEANQVDLAATGKGYVNDLVLVLYTPIVWMSNLTLLRLCCNPC
jgi:hypothetical protein